MSIGPSGNNFVIKLQHNYILIYRSSYTVTQYNTHNYTTNTIHHYTIIHNKHNYTQLYTIIYNKLSRDHDVICWAKTPFVLSSLGLSHYVHQTLYKITAE